MTRPSMLAVLIPRYGGPEVLELREIPRPAPGPGEVLVRVRATALNRADLLQREGRYPAPPGAAPDVPGLEFVGEVAETGDGARRWKQGDRVFGITGGGGHAEFVVAHERAVAAVPVGMSWTDAAAVPEAFITAHDALLQAAVRPEDAVLVHAVGSGVGLAGVQVARALGARPFGTARTADKVERAREFGLVDGIALPDGLEPLAAAVERWTGGAGIDVVLDLVGGDYAAANVAVAAPKARIILIGTVAGRSATLPLGQVLGKRLTIRGTVLRARPLEEKIVATRAFEREIVPLLARGTLRPTVDTVLPLTDIARAHELLASNATFGKVVLTVE